MSQRWALQLRRDEAALAGRLRSLPSVEVCEHGESIWLRGVGSEEAQRALRRFPVGQQFRLLEDFQLVRHDKVVPQGELPKATWQPLADWLTLRMPIAQFAARPHRKAALTIIRDEREREANLLLTNGEAWLAYVATAPAVRLRCWAFALADDRRVLVRGTPLPPLAGERYVEVQGLAVPAGHCWSPAIEAGVLRAWLALGPLDVALWQTDGSWEHITAGDFVQATRSATRQSLTGEARD